MARPARLELTTFWSEFDAAQPRILGAILDAVSISIARESTISMTTWPRMADFARWVTAAEPGFDWPDGRFLAAYYANRGSAHEMALEADPVAVALRTLMESTSEWEGTPSGLLAKLGEIAGEEATKRKDWPGAASKLTNRLERLAPNLRAIGISVERARTGSHRTVMITTGDDGPGDRHTQTQGHHAPASSNGHDRASLASPSSQPRSAASPGSDASDASDATSQAPDNDIRLGLPFDDPPLLDVEVDDPHSSWDLM